LKEHLAVILRHFRDDDGVRHLEASISEAGDLVIEGQDLGDGVERAFGVREYEWTWTVRAPYLPDLLRVLGATGDVLAALAARFSGENAAELGSFLQSEGIPHERWSRLGD
jgi:hypothetical protein